jgi:myo-inositol-1(or 4)-monophosphatase
MTTIATNLVRDMAVCSFPCLQNRQTSYRRPVAEHLRAVQSCLEASCEYVRFGSGALGMAFAADGRLDGYYEAHINVWDVAAGLVLVQEAGGRNNDFLGKPDAFAAGNVILAATPALERPLTELLLSR